MRRRISIPLLFLCCWCTYLTAYLCRVNFSTALPALAKDLSVARENLGTVGAAFFSVYALGQLINGFLGDHVRPTRFILIALTGTAACNIGVAFVPSYGAVLLLWSANGYFQSIFWSTMIRLLALNIPPEKRASISTGISTSISAGFILSWSVLGQVLSGGPSFPFFAIPAACVVLMILAWLLMARYLAQDTGMNRLPPRTVRQTVQFIAQKGLAPMVALCVCQGLIKEGVAFWFPLLLMNFTAGAALSPALLLTTVPLANLLGMFLAKWMQRLGRDNPYAMLAFCFTGSAGLCCALYLAERALLIVALIASVSCLSYVANTILMAALPMRYARENMVASLVGVFDFASYVGAALSTYALGRILARSGFSAIPAIWMGAALAASLIGYGMWVRYRKQKDAHA